MSVLSIASAPPAALTPTTPTSPTPPAANDDAQAASLAVEVSLSAEATLTLSVYQETQVTISAGGGAANALDGAADPDTARALSTLKNVDDAERAWLAAIKAQFEGRPAPKAQAVSEAKSKDGANGGSLAAPTSALQVTVQQSTVVEASLQVGAEIDIRA
jgi:hypothetical protein